MSIVLGSTKKIKMRLRGVEGGQKTHGRGESLFPALVRFRVAEKALKVITESGKQILLLFFFFFVSFQICDVVIF